MESFLLYVAILSTVLLLFKVGASFLGGHFHHVGDHDTDHGDGHFHLNVLTFQNFVSFFTMFSWVGLACLKSNFSTLSTITLASASGIAMVLIMALMMFFASKLTQDGTQRIEDVIGKTGTVYLKVPNQRSGIGKINVVCGSLLELEALTDNKIDIITGSTVKVVSVISSSMVLVEVV